MTSQHRQPVLRTLTDPIQNSEGVPVGEDKTKRMENVSKSKAGLDINKTSFQLLILLPFLESSLLFFKLRRKKGNQ